MVVNMLDACAIENMAVLVNVSSGNIDVINPLVVLEAIGDQNSRLPML